ncbi:Uncharacterized protein HZ326_25033 [Fusarium oxysporum f. sp. albedinis]|nr:Condensin complex subunit 2 [Fusarium oxysporum f. sp. albedinis]KAJ0131870.1 Uncharacterized protein HZ326_25033 [Fusarium oxysporum f. sp. albedinis]
MSAQRPHFRLVTVNTSPERARRLIGRMIEALKDDYKITHVDNCSSIDQVLPKVYIHKPNLLFSASMWTPEEAQQIQTLARSVVADIKVLALPTGLQLAGGPDAVVEFLLKEVPLVLDS